VQLIDTGTGSHIWAERFDREATEIFSIQDQVVQTIVSTLVGRVQASYAERTRRMPPASLDAYECVLKGNALSWSDPNGEAEAKRLFERAIELDPGYGFAHALLAHMCLEDSASDRDARLQRAYTLAQRGVELSPNESTCFATLGAIHLKRRSFDLAIQCTRRATELNPTNQWNAADMGSVLIFVGQADEALGWFRRAKEIDPYFDPPWFWRAYGHGYMILRRYKEALAMFEKIPARNAYATALMAGCHAQLAQMDQARDLAAECLAMEPGFSIGRLMKEEPFKNPADAAHQSACLKMAGLPD
jgi:tetratricopeptide (TPR) repeat protein